MSILANDSLPVHVMVDHTAGMEHVEGNHNETHEESIEDVEEVLLRLELTVLAHDVLGDTEDGSDHDEQTGRVKHEEELLPRRCDLLRLLCGVAVDAEVEDESDDHEEAEENDLNA